MTDQTHLYQRGTKTDRITTARLAPGDQVLTEQTTTGRLFPATRKTTSTVRTVDRIEAFVPAQQDTAHGWNKPRRQGGRRTVVFTDGTAAYNLAAHETWPILTAPQEA